MTEAKQIIKKAQLHFQNGGSKLTEVFYYYFPYILTSHSSRSSPQRLDWGVAYKLFESRRNVAVGAYIVQKNDLILKIDIRNRFNCRKARGIWVEKCRAEQNNDCQI